MYIENNIPVCCVRFVMKIKLPILRVFGLALVGPKGVFMKCPLVENKLPLLYIIIRRNNSIAKYLKPGMLSLTRMKDIKFR